MSLSTGRRLLPVIIFFALVLVPVVLFGIDGPYRGKALAPAEQDPWPRRVTQHLLSEFGNWASNRVGLRPLLRDIGWQYHVAWLRWPAARKGAFGSHSWLFYTDEDAERARMQDFRGGARFRNDQIVKIKANLRLARERFAACGIAFRVVLVPNKQSIYGRFLGGDETSVRTRIDDLMDRLDAATRAAIIDLRAPLRAAAAREEPYKLYQKTDTHWNDLGAFYAYRAILDQLAAETPIRRLDLAERENFVVEERPTLGGDIASILMLRDQFSDTETLLQSHVPVPRITKEAVIGRLHYDLRNEDSGDANGSVLIFGDSFAESLGRLLARHFRSVYVRPPADDATEPTRLRPRIVLLETVARQVQLLQYSMSGIDHVCAPGS